MFRCDGEKVAVVGLGAIANPPLIEFLVARGAVVTACDRKTQAELGDVYERLRRLPIEFRLGSSYLHSLDAFDRVYLTPAVRRDLPEVQAAKEAGVPIGSEILLFMELCGAHTLAVTGSSGKTTTTTILGEIWRAAGRETYVAGNIGVSLIQEAEAIPPAAWVILELSSFQLQDFTLSPDIAAVTNITPNHLDYHPSMREYEAAKRNIYLHQGPSGTVVLNWDDPQTRAMATSAPGRVLFFSRREALESGAYVQADRVTVALDGHVHDICAVRDILLPGGHNLENVLTASALALAAGIPAGAVAEVVATFPGVEHRLELVRELRGARYYNDSKATTPAGTLAAIEAIETPITLIAGGHDKKLPFDGLAAALPGRVRNLVLLGATSGAIREAAEEANRGADAPVSIHDTASLEAAVSLAAELVGAGEAVLLSPACASYDMFRNYEERGNRFRELVMAL